MSFALLAILLLAGGHTISAAPTASTVSAWSAQGQSHLTYDATTQRIYYVDNVGPGTGVFRFLDTTTDLETNVKTFSGPACSDTGLTGTWPSLGITMTAPNTFLFAAASQGKIFSYVNSPSSSLVRVAGRTDCTAQLTNAENVTATSQRFFPYGVRYHPPSNTIYFVSQQAGFIGVGLILPSGNFQIYAGAITNTLTNTFVDNTFRTNMRFHHIDDTSISDATNMVMISGVHGVWAIDRATGLGSSVTNTNGPATNLCTGCAASTFSARGLHVTGVIEHPNAQAAFFTVWGGSGGVWQVDIPFNQVCRRYAVSHATHVVLTDDTTMYGKSLNSQGYKIVDLEGCAITWGTQDPAVAAFCDDIASQCTAMSTECDTIRTNGETAVADDCDATVAACNDVHDDCVTKASNCPLV